MTEIVTHTSGPAVGKSTTTGRLFVLELSGDRIHSMNPDGSNRRTIVTDCHLPDGIVVDAEAGHIYWTNMGIPNLDDGSIERADLDGGNRRVIVPQGVTHTPKQIHLDKGGGKLYWCDREGMRVMRANLDGSQAETLVETGRGDADRRDQTRWCVGITIEPQLGKIYWTQKGPTKGGLGRLCRANIDVPAARARRTAPISRCCSVSCPNPSISSSMWRTAFSIGPTAAILRAATPSIACRSTTPTRRRKF